MNPVRIDLSEEVEGLKIEFFNLNGEKKGEYSFYNYEGKKTSSVRITKLTKAEDQEQD